MAALACLAMIGWVTCYRKWQEAAQAADRARSRLAELEAQMATLRHDLNGILSPALLSADRLLDSQDPVARRAGEVMVRTVERTTARMAETKPQQP
jgi:type II secretory pathway component PulJ